MTRRLYNSLWLAVLYGAVLALVGCGPYAPTSANSATGSALARIDARAQDIATNAASLSDHTGEPGKPFLHMIIGAAWQIRQDVLDAAESNARQASDLQIVTGERDEAMGTVGYRIGQWVKRSAWIVGGIILAVVGLRVFGLTQTGLIGSIASWTATGIVALATGGLSLLQWGFDNLWFRWFKPREPGGMG